MPCRSLPVPMYHYVSRLRGPINVTPETFEEHCRSMAQAGWRGIGLDEAEAWLRGEGSLPKRCALITFDDGFLDNYVHAWPILEKYGHKGVIFAVTERIDKDASLRPTLRDVWNTSLPPDALPPVDSPLTQHALGYTYRNDLFMNWAEARALEASGVVAVAGHTARHLMVFADGLLPPRRKDLPAEEDVSRCFHTPKGHGNTFYLLTGQIPWGLPRFAEQPAMSGPGWLPSEELLAAVHSLVPQHKAEAFAFFQDQDRVEALHRLIDRFAPEALGRMESEDDARARMAEDLALCAATLRQELGHEVASLCWPWGKGSDLAREEAEKQGFSVFFTTRSGANSRGNTHDIHRFKARNKPWPWLGLRLRIYSRPLLAKAYSRLKNG